MGQRVATKGRSRKAATPMITTDNPFYDYLVNKDKVLTEKDVEVIEEAPIEEVVEVIDSLPAPKEEDAVAVKNERPMRLTREQRSDTDLQLTEIKGIVGDVLIHMRQAVQKKQLDFNQELKLLTTFAPYLGYDKVGNKTAEDIGMDSFAMKYIEINAHVKTAQEKSISKVSGK